MTNIQLVQSKFFGEVKCDFWQDDNNQIWMTRDQIGKALNYSEPRKAIQKLHERHVERLNEFSAVVKLGTTDGKAYDTYIYSFKYGSLSLVKET